LKIALFGPPGIGKSTLIKQLGGYDAEDNWPNYDKAKLRSSQYVGTAGLQVEDPILNGYLKVLLYLPQSEYDSRRKTRDANQTEKANQAHHKISDWMTGKFDLMLLANRRALDIIRLLGRDETFEQRRKL